MHQQISAEKITALADMLNEFNIDSRAKADHEKHPLSREWGYGASHAYGYAAKLLHQLISGEAV